MKFPHNSSSNPQAPDEPHQYSRSLPPRSLDAIDIPLSSKPNITISEYSSKPITMGTKRLSVGEGVSLSGKVLNADSVVLQGAAEGEIAAELVEISMSGTLTGIVNSESLIVAGTLKGKVTVVGILTVCSTGYIDGEICYGRLVIEEGGTIIGSLTQDNKNLLSPSPLKKGGRETASSHPSS